MNNVQKQDLSVIKQVMDLQNKSLREFDKLWAKMFDHPPAIASREYMISKLAYRIQELAYGGIDDATENKIKAAAKEISKTKKAPTRKFCPMIGTKIVKEYKGANHEVFVIPDGFSYCGEVYNSLSAVAGKITGTKWNGVKFFNLRD